MIRSQQIAELRRYLCITLIHIFIAWRYCTSKKGCTYLNMTEPGYQLLGESPLAHFMKKIRNNLLNGPQNVNCGYICSCKTTLNIFQKCNPLYMNEFLLKLLHRQTCYIIFLKWESKIFPSNPLHVYFEPFITLSYRSTNQQFVCFFLV